jgi:hypothetical protein
MSPAAGGRFAVVLRVLAGAAIVEAVAISSFGLVAGTAIAALVAMLMGITLRFAQPSTESQRNMRPAPGRGGAESGD